MPSRRSRETLSFPARSDGVFPSVTSYREGGASEVARHQTCLDTLIMAGPGYPTEAGYDGIGCDANLGGKISDAKSSSARGRLTVSSI